MPEKSTKWRDFLISFAAKIGKPDPEVYVDEGKWKARQGGNGLPAAGDVKIRFTNCTAQEHAKIYRLNRPFDEELTGMFVPFGRVAPELGRKLLHEVLVLDIKSNVPILSLQPFTQDGFEYSVKVRTLNVADHDVVYDEFSKYLEANIKEASVSDTKTLQDFAEKCNRSGSMQLHLMLISHKEISNYIDTLPKQKVDGWRGVSERFKHIHLNNNFSQTYEIIASVIQKEPTKWARFQKNHQKDLEELLGRYKNHPLFSANSTELETAIMGCYPLHPVSTFILPRLSERVAQNERTLFTFLSAEGTSTLRSFIDVYDDDSFNLITPDEIYDYFEPLFKKETFGGEIHDIYLLTSAILSSLAVHSLEAKIVKTLSLIYVLEQFERLKPTKDEIVGVYSSSFSVKDINAAIDKRFES